MTAASFFRTLKFTPEGRDLSETESQHAIPVFPQTFCSLISPSTVMRWQSCQAQLDVLTC